MNRLYSQIPLDIKAMIESVLRRAAYAKEIKGNVGKARKLEDLLTGGVNLPTGVRQKMGQQAQTFRSRARDVQNLKSEGIMPNRVQGKELEILRQFLQTLGIGGPNAG